MHARTARFWCAAAACAALALFAGGAHAQQQTPFDHLTTGFELIGQHRDLPCESCHVNAIFKGTPRDCAACHGVGTQVRATAKPVNHILTSNRCEACHTPLGWSPAVNFDHAEVMGSCSSCHNNVQAQGMGPNHIQTDLECDACHSTIGWAGAVFNHPQVTSGCVQCHTPGGAGKSLPANHIPTADIACEGCHIPTQYTSFAGATMNHAVVTAIRCDACHESGSSWIGVTIVTRPGPPHPVVGTGDCNVCHLDTVSFKSGNVMPSGHIPTTQACTLCHANPADYSIYVMNHQGITSGCDTCHGAGKSFTNMAPPVLKVPPANHVAFGTAACESCHLNTSVNTGGFQFTNASGAAPPAMVHSAVASQRCDSCHGAGMTDVGVPPTVVLPANHVAINGADCLSCHAGTSSFKFTNASGAAPPAMVHSVVSGLACSSCHEAGRTDIGMPPTVVRPATVASGAAHVVSGECSNCHQSTVTFKGASNFPTNHIPLPNGQNANCSDCHANAADYSLNTTMNHAVVVTTCATCHGPGKSFANMVPPTLVLPPGDHIPFGTAPCESCHLSSSVAPGGFKFTNLSGTAPAAMVHAAVPGVACATCHGVGKTWAGAPATVVPPANHVPFGAAPCESCHLSSSVATGGFKLPSNVSGTAPPAMVHSAVAGVACATCHGVGKTWIGTPATMVPPANHVPFGSAACESCHLSSSVATGGFKLPSNVSGTAPPAMVHSAVAGTACATCHGAGKTWIGAPATMVPPANHVPFGTAACEGCHMSSSVATGGFKFTNATGTAPPAMVHTLVSSTACSTCHEAGKTDVGAPPTVVRPALKADGTAHVAGGECSTCHFNTTSFKGASDLPANHIPLPAADNNNCALCHSDASNYSIGTMNHANIANNCAQCHGAGKSFANMAPPTLVLPPANHVPFGTAPCESCHLNTSVATGGFKFTNASGTAPAAMVHSAVAGTACATCHGTGKTWVGAPATMVPPANHVPFGTAACEGCHMSSSVATGGFKFTNATGTAPPAMVHTLVSSTACSTCHEAGKTDVGAPPTVVRPALKADGTAHVAGGECSTCHFNTTSFKGASDLPANHIPLPAADNNNCTLCHSNPADYSVGTMNHVNITNNCAQCHATGKSFANMAPPTLVLPPANHVPFGTAPCESCHLNTSVATGGFKFTNASGTAPSAMVHAAVPGVACATCHGIGKTWVGTPATVVPPANHVPFGTAPCESCHLSTSVATGGFKFTNASGTAPSAMVHSAVSGVACATCHGIGKTWVGTPVTVVPPANHVPFGTAPCESCHLSTSVATGGFKFSNVSGTAPSAMVHSAVSGVACATCHGIGKTWVGAPVTVVPPANHVPFGTAACEGCHLSSSVATGGFRFTNATGTAPPSMVHTLVSSLVCSTCHEAGRTWVGAPTTVVRPAKKADGTAHVTGGECSTCHFNTTSFKGASDLPANHIPLPAADNNNCALCHTTAGNYSLAVMNHVNITTNCMQCHAYGLSFANMAPPTLKAPPSGATGHIPSNPPNGTQNIACEQCHLPTVFTTFAGTVMKHAAVRAMTCMSCHEIGMTWKTNTGVRLWVRDSANHYKGQDCGGSGCHSARDRFGARRGVAISAAQKAGGATAVMPALGAAGALGRTASFNHRRVAGTACVSCHDVVSGTGKTANHIATSDTCESCHTTTAWLPVTRVDHLQVKGSCVSCHNKTVASGKGSNHIASSDTCETCHTTNAWTPARFDHVGVAAHACKSCHDSLHATGLPVNHVPTSAECDTCHGTLGWKPAKLDHTNLTSNCASCHNNSIALGVPPVHMSTQRDCATCHSYADWTVLHFVHSSASFPAGHKAALACAACHTTNTDQIAWASPADAGTCGGCHATEFKPDLHPKASGGLLYTASELKNCSGACHVYSDATMGTVVKSMPGPYHRVSDAAFKH